MTVYNRLLQKPDLNSTAIIMVVVFGAVAIVIMTLIDGVGGEDDRGNDLISTEELHAVGFYTCRPYRFPRERSSSLLTTCSAFPRLLKIL